MSAGGGAFVRLPYVKHINAFTTINRFPGFSMIKGLLHRNWANSGLIQDFGGLAICAQCPPLHYDFGIMEHTSIIMDIFEAFSDLRLTYLVPEHAEHRVCTFQAFVLKYKKEMFNIKFDGNRLTSSKSNWKKSKNMSRHVNIHEARVTQTVFTTFHVNLWDTFFTAESKYKMYSFAGYPEISSFQIDSDTQFEQRKKMNESKRRSALNAVLG
jgi:hypothetical protein